MKNTVQGISTALREQLQARCAGLRKQAVEHYRVDLPHIVLRTDLHGTAAGRAYPASFTVRINPVLLTENPAAFLREVIAHEVAHLVAFRVFGDRIRPHGREWSDVMRFFGAEPRRCHEFDIARAAVRKQRRYPYRCGCREHALSTTRHNRVRRGEQSYRCRHCGQKLLETEDGITRRSR